jgi:hypothetical protein
MEIIRCSSSCGDRTSMFSALLSSLEQWHDDATAAAPNKPTFRVTSGERTLEREKQKLSQQYRSWEDEFCMCVPSG